MDYLFSESFHDGEFIWDAQLQNDAHDREAFNEIMDNAYKFTSMAVFKGGIVQPMIGDKGLELCLF